MTGIRPSSASTGITPSSAAPVISSACSVDFTVVSRACRAAAMAMPASSPTVRARAMLRTGCGDTGASGTSAGLTTLTRTAAGRPSGVFSSAGTSAMNSSATAVAIRWASCGDGSVTRMVSRLVSSTASVVTRVASACGDTARPSRLTTPRMTRVSRTMRVYDLTFCCESRSAW
jgi:hypothetical protein